MNDAQEAKDFLLGKKKIGLICKDSYDVILIQRIENSFGTVLRQKAEARNLVKILAGFDGSVTYREHMTKSLDGNIVIAFTLKFTMGDDRNSFVKRFNEYMEFVEGIKP